MFRPVLCLILLLACCARAEESADLTFKLPAGQSVRYQFTSTSSSVSVALPSGAAPANTTPLQIKSDGSTQMVLTFKSLASAGTPAAPAAKGTPVSIRIQNYALKDKRSMGDDSGELEASRGHIRAVRNGKVTIDSINDVGLAEVKEYQQLLQLIESGEMRVTLEPSGRMGIDADGDPTVIDVVHACGAEGMLRLAAGKALKPGEAWDDAQTMTTVGAFKLAKPLAVRARSIFRGWETKDGVRLARIEIASVWDPADLKGENEDGVEVGISNVNGEGGGSALFDPAKGQFVEGSVQVTTKYRLNGKQKDGTTTQMDVSSKTAFSFKRVP
jgi:hypothetical protein